MLISDERVFLELRKPGRDSLSDNTKACRFQWLLSNFTTMPSKFQDEAQFATTARLLSCLVTESLVSAYYFPVDGPSISGFATIFKGTAESTKQQLQSGNVLALVPLYQAPIIKPDGKDAFGKEIGLLDPLDMVHLVFEVGDAGLVPDTGLSEVMQTNSASLEKFWLCWVNSIKKSSHSSWMNLKRMASWSWMGIKCTNQRTSYRFGTSSLRIMTWILQSSRLLRKNLSALLNGKVKKNYHWDCIDIKLILSAAYSYEHPPEAPLFTSPSIVWEQSIVEGHPTHPVGTLLTTLRYPHEFVFRCTRPVIFYPLFQITHRDHLTFFIHD